MMLQLEVNLNAWVALLAELASRLWVPVATKFSALDGCIAFPNRCGVEINL